MGKDKWKTLLKCEGSITEREEPEKNKRETESIEFEEIKLEIYLIEYHA